MGGEGDDRGWDGWIPSLTQWTRVWVNSGSWWWTGSPGMLQSMGLQIVGYDFATELNWTERLPWASQVVLENPPANTGRSYGGGHGHPLWYFCLENPKDRVAWWATIQRVVNSRTWLKQFSMAQGFPTGLVRWRIYLQYRRLLARLRSGFDPWIRKIPWRRKWQPSPVFLPGKSHGQRRVPRVRHDLSAKPPSPCGP